MARMATRNRLGFKMLYVLTGTDEYAILNELSRIKTYLNISDESLENSLIKIRPENITLESVRRYTHTLPFLSLENIAIYRSGGTGHSKCLL